MPPLGNPSRPACALRIVVEHHVASAKHRRGRSPSRRLPEHENPFAGLLMSPIYVRAIDQDSIGEGQFGGNRGGCAARNGNLPDRPLATATSIAQKSLYGADPRF